MRDFTGLKQCAFPNKEGVNPPFLVCSNRGSYILSNVQEVRSLKSNHIHIVHIDEAIKSLKSLHSWYNSINLLYNIYLYNKELYNELLYNKGMNQTKNQMGDDQASAEKILVKDLPRGGR